MLDVYTDTYFMKQAFLEAQKAFDKGEVPVGAVVVCNNQIIAKAKLEWEKQLLVSDHGDKKEHLRKFKMQLIQW